MPNVTMIIAALLSGDEKNRSSTTVEGHALRIDNIAVIGEIVPAGRQGPAVKHVSITFAAEPKDPSKSYAYEIGRRFVARDAAGKEIRLGPIHGVGGREPSFRVAGFPPKKDDPFRGFHAAITVSLRLQDPAVTMIATLEGDLFVSEVETLEFTFAGKELDPNCTKTVRATEAKLVMFDETPRGFDVAFKLKLPVRSSPEALGGGARGLASQICLLYATDGGRKFPLTNMGSSMGGGSTRGDDPRQRYEREFHNVGLDRRPEALHLVLPNVELPRRHVFHLKDVPIPAPAPPQRPGRPGGGIAMN